MRIQKWFWATLMLGGGVITSCKKEISQNEPEITTAAFPTTPEMKERVTLLKEVGEVLKKVYQDPKAYYEVNAAILSGYYEDERVLLKDLLFPETSSLYKQNAFKKFGAKPGVFKTAFYEVLHAGGYPSLNSSLRSKAPDRQLSGIEPRLSTAAPTDTAMEIFSNSNGVSIYFPYSENFGAAYGPTYFDNINSGVRSDHATIVAADREADSGPGDEPYICGTRLNQRLCYNTVTVDDAYAELKPTHIVGIGAEPIMVPNPVIADAPPGSQVNRVYHGWSKLVKQLDRFISFTGNGGGSEVKVSRISGYLAMENQQITTTTDDRISIHYKRKDINKRRWKRVYGVWDADWVPGNLEQVYAAWEDDKQGTSTLTGSLTTTVKRKLNDNTEITVTGTVGYSITGISQDDIITQRKITRNSYFRDAKNDQGWGFQMCDDKGCRYDNTFLPQNQYWPKYDEGSNWSYTWSYKTF